MHRNPKPEDILIGVILIIGYLAYVAAAEPEIFWPMVILLGIILFGVWLGVSLERRRSHKKPGNLQSRPSGQTARQTQKGAFQQSGSVVRYQKTAKSQKPQGQPSKQRRDELTGSPVQPTAPKPFVPPPALPKNPKLQGNQSTEKPKETPPTGGFSSSGSVVKYQRVPRPPAPPSTPPAPPAPQSEAAKGIQRIRDFAGTKMFRLDQLTRNQATSERLVALVHRRYPDQTLTWCVDKAISDLERDRYRR